MSVPASDAQLGLWLTERALGPHPAHHLAFGVWLDGPLDADALVRACCHVARRHPALRCAVVEEAGTPTVRDTHVEPDVELAPLTLGDVERHLRQPFDLATGPLIRFRVLIRSPERALLLVVAHHLVLDGDSKDLLLADLAEAYGTLVGGRPLDAEPLPFTTPAGPPTGPVGPADAVDAVDAVDAARAYWARTGHSPGDVVLPGLRAAQAGPGHGAARSVTVDPAAADRLRDAAAAWGVTPYEALVAGVHALLVRYGSDDPVLTLPLSTRPLPAEQTRTAQTRTAQTHGQIGLHVNELPFRPPAVTGGFADHARAVRSALRELYRHRGVPLARAVSGLRPAAAWSPVVLGYRRRAQTPSFTGLTADVQWVVPTGASRAALEFQVVDGGPGAALDILVRVRTGLTTTGLTTTDLTTTGEAGQDEAARICGHLLCLLDAAMTDPGRPVAGLPLLTPGERDRSLATSAGPVRPDHPTRTVLSLLDAQTRARPDAVAVVDGDTEWTYRDLDDAVTRVSAALVRLGVVPGDRVAVALGRSSRAVAVLLAVMRCGAAYVPIDPAHPASRRELVLDDAAPRLVVVEPSPLAPSQRAGADDGPVPTVPASGLLASGPPASSGTSPTSPRAQGPVVPGPVVPGPADVAYVMYTSGSTGRPKGVAVSHGALANLLLGMAEEVGGDPAHRWLQLTTLSFDISGLELYLPLVTGGTVVVASSVSGADGPGVLRLVRVSGVTHVQATPSQWRILLDAGLGADGQGQGLPVVALAGGEALPLPVAVELRSKVAALFDVYGPTETTIWSTTDAVPPSPDDVTIGRPIANTRTYVLDGHLGLRPDGVPGELAIAGAGVADGYLNRPGLTASRFVPDPHGPAGSRMYLTGDACVRHADGRLRFLGRGDGQVKIRGHRVELGEIENRLLGHPGVDDVAVVVRGEGAAQQVVACVVAHAGADRSATTTTTATTTTADADAEVSAAGLRAHVAAVLPSVMVPTGWELVDALPRTPNGKLDRGTLAAGPAPGARPMPSVPTASAPATATSAGPLAAGPLAAGPEQIDGDRIAAGLQAIWSEVLQIPDVGVDEDLFDLGAHSLTIARLISRILQQFGVDVPLDVFFDTPTIREIAVVVAAGGEVTACLA